MKSRKLMTNIGLASLAGASAMAFSVANVQTFADTEKIRLIRSRNSRRLTLAAACAAITLLFPTIPAANAETIIDTWKSIAVPPPPELQAVTVDSAPTALLILDISAVNCAEAQRPRCAVSIPRVQHLLAEARAHKMM